MGSWLFSGAAFQLGKWEVPRWMVVMLCCTVDVFIVTELQMLNIIKTINLGAWGMVQAKEQLPSMQAQSSVLPTAKKKMINLMCILSQLKKKSIHPQMSMVLAEKLQFL
jgi:hypothetical protein